MRMVADFICVQPSPELTKDPHTLELIGFAKDAVNEILAAQPRDAKVLDLIQAVNKSILKFPELGEVFIHRLDQEGCPTYEDDPEVVLILDIRRSIQ